MGVGAAMVSADWVVLVSVLEAPTNEFNINGKILNTNLLTPLN
jgi:hypothetical protein